MDPKIMIAVVAVIFAADMGWQMFQNKKRNELFDRLSSFLAKKEYDAFDELIDSPQTRKLFPAFNIAFLKLNEAMLKEDREAVDRAFGQFDVRMNGVQKEALYKKGFYYYLGLEDRTKTRVYYDLLKGLKVRDEQMIDVMYDTYIDKGYGHIDEIKALADQGSEEQKMPYYALLADMYRNKGEEDTAKEYEKKVSEYTETLQKGKK
ncbi:MAG: hypothetical protein IIZ28_02140 [Erysipelotrichaceae bacterium]|nr:hypothetical protein [Erysipelotrichaceae bacterium]